MPARRAAQIRGLSHQVRRLVLLNDLLRAHVAGELRIGTTELTALGELTAHGRLSASQLASNLQIPAATTTGVVDRLVAAGFAERLKDPADRRRIIVAPTPGGTHARAWAESRLTALIDSALGTEASDTPTAVEAFLGELNTALAEELAQLGGRGAARRIQSR